MAETINTEEKELLKADIRGGATAKTIIIFCIVYVILVAVGFLVGTDKDEYYGRTYYQVCWYGLWIYDGWDFLYGRNPYDEIGIIISLAIAVSIPLIFFLWNLLVRKNCARSKLVLTDKKIYGSHKWFFKNEQLLMPMSKIDNIIIRYNLRDRLYGGGGRTVRIASNSGYVNFPCIQNADEFVSLAMEQVEKFRKDQNDTAASPSSDEAVANKLRSLQYLKEQGVLSEEEFNAKKAELISKL